MSGAIAAIFQPGINKFFGLRVDQYDPIYTRVFNIVDMKGRFLMRQGMVGYGPPAITLPLQQAHMDEIRTSFSSGYTPIKRTLGDVVAEEDWDDDPYGILRRVIPARSGAMAEVYTEKSEWDAANYLAVTGYSTTSPCPHSPDGQPLFSASHPISLYDSGTTLSNITSVPTALSHTAYYAAYGVMVQYKGPNNYSLVKSYPKQLIYNPKIRAVAVQLAKGEYERDSSYYHNMNMAKRDNLELVEWAHYRKTLSTSAANSWDSWVLLGPNHTLNYVRRMAFRAKADYDINQQAFIWVTATRYDIGHDDWRDTYASAN